MNMLNRKYTIKKIAAAALAVMISLSVFGIGIDSRGADIISDRGVISGNAAENDENAEYDRQLAELERRKAELDKKIAAAGSDIKGQQEKLDAVNEKAEVIKKKIAKVSKKSEELENEMCDIDDAMRETMYNLEQSEAAISTGLEEFKERLRVMYVAGNDSYSQVLVNAESFYDVLMRIELVKRVAEHDNETIDTLLEQKSQIEAYQTELEEQSAALKEKSAEYAEKQKELAEQQAELFRMQQEYGDSIEALQGDLTGFISEAELISKEYDRVKEAARTTTTTTTTPAEITVPDDPDNSSGGTTTTKKSTDPDNGSDGTSTTTKKTTESSSAPDETQATTTTREETTTTTRAPETTTSSETTTTTTAPQTDPEPDTSGDLEKEIKRNTVVSYAKGMVGGRYVWAGEQYGATDCSGLVMLSYRQIGIRLPHLAQSQASYGTTVARSEMLPGDLVFFGSWSNIYHVAMYIGDGKIVHAESTATGIVISYLDSVARYNNIVCCKRLI